MTRAEEKSIVYQFATHGPRVMGGAAILSEEDYKFWNINYDFKAGYEEAEKDIKDHLLELVEEEAKFWDDGEMIFRRLKNEIKEL